jgi:basic amino acid/polyamine antiporter, APA family
MPHRGVGEPLPFHFEARALSAGGMAPPRADLNRGLGRFDLAAITLTTVVGAGIFTLPAALVASAGSWTIGILLFTIALVAATALCTAEVASRYEVTGGPLVFAHDAFGALAGFVIGWLMYLSRLSSFGAIAVIMLDYAAGLWPVLEGRGARVGAITVFIAALTAINVAGVVRGAAASNVLTAVKIIPLVLLAIAGLTLPGSRAITQLPLPGAADLGGAVLLAFFACMGFEIATVIAGEARDARRNVPAGMLLGVAGTGLLYLLVVLACMALVPNLATSPRPLAEAAAALVGGAGATLLAGTAVVSCAGALVAWMIGGPRVLLGLAAYGDLPAAVGSVHASRRTPHVAIIASGVLVWLLTISGTFVYLATFSALSRLVTYGSICVALLVLRRRDGPAPLPIPFGALWAVLALLGSVAAIALATTTLVVIRDLAIALALGLAVRAVARRRNESPAE